MLVAAGPQQALAQSTATYTYDVLGRVVTTTYPSGSSTTYSYDPADNRTHLISALVVNHAPVAYADSASTQTGATVSINVLANDTDADGNALTLVSVGTPTGGSASISGTVVSYAAPATAGTYTFTYTINDGHGATATGTVTVTVSVAPPVNHPPVAVADTVATAYQTAVSFNPLGNDTDPDSDPLTIQSVGNGTKGTASFSGSTVTYTPAAGATGTDSFSYTINDARGGTASASVSVTIGAPQATVARPDAIYLGAPFVITSGQYSFIIRVGCTDVLANDSGSNLTITNPGRGAVNGTSTICYSTGDPADATPFTYTISGDAGSASATITIVP